MKADMISRKRGSGARAHSLSTALVTSCSPLMIMTLALDALIQLSPLRVLLSMRRRRERWRTSGPFLGCPGCRSAGSGSHQAELAQLPPQLLRHRCRAGRRFSKIAGRVLCREVAPALEGTKRARRNQDHLRIKHQAAPSNAVLVAEWPHGADALTAGDLAADHPEQRTAISQLC